MERKEAEVKDVDVRFWIRRVEERRNDIVCGRDAKNLKDGGRDTCYRVSGRKSVMCTPWPDGVFPRTKGSRGETSGWE